MHQNPFALQCASHSPASMVLRGGTVRSRFDCVKRRDSQVLKRELLMTPFILLPARPQKLKHLQYSANEDFCLVQTQGSFGGWRSEQLQVNREL